MAFLFLCTNIGYSIINPIAFYINPIILIKNDAFIVLLPLIPFNHTMKSRTKILFTICISFFLIISIQPQTQVDSLKGVAWQI